MKKILIVGPDFYHYNESIQRGFLQNDVDANVLTIPTWKYANLMIRLGLNKSKSSYKYINRINEIILKSIHNDKYDFILFIKGDYLLESTLKIIDNKKLILWAIDSIFRITNIVPKFKYFEKIYSFENNDINVLKSDYGVDSEFLPMAYDPYIYKPLNFEKKDIDICFIGRLSDERIEYLLKIIDKFPSLKIKIFGKKYVVKARPLDFYLKKRKYFIHKKLLPMEVNKIYNRSKICLNIHNSQSEDGVNPRFFEILGSRSLQIVNKNKFILSNYNKGEVLTFSTDLELYRLIKNVIKEYPNDLVIKGYNKVKKADTFFHRAQSILEEYYK